MQDEILQGNKVIAEFMDGEIQAGGELVYYPYWHYHHRYYKTDELQYHKDYGWLMPVVEKIARLQVKYKDVDELYNPFPRTFAMPDTEGNMMVRFNASPVFTAPTLIEATWVAVVDFITDFNSDKNDERSVATDAQPKN